MIHQKRRLAAGLYLVATPIGTARDITLRALDIFASADFLAAEDTRSLRKLLEIHGVPLEGRKIVSYHDHSGSGPLRMLLQVLEEGKSVAYASEAGMPLISDPGFELSRDAAAAGHLVTCAPGASAVLTAMTLAGLPTDAFFFAGFLPNASGQRKKRLGEIKDIPGTLAFYESPKRLTASLSDMLQILGDRPAAVCRELTKKFEETRRNTISALIEDLKDRPAKGEVVVLVDRARSQAVNEADIEKTLLSALENNSVRDAANIVSEMYDQPRRKVYQMALSLAKESGK